MILYSVFFSCPGSSIPDLGKSTNDDNDNCNANYDSNDGNFDDYDEKMTKKHINIMTFQQ